MRKILVVFLFFLSFVATAQTKIGVRGGMNLSNFIYRPQYSGDNKGMGSYLPSLNAGLMIEIPLNDDNDWFIYTGPYYSGKGNKIKGIRPTITFDTVVTYLNYVELPVSFGYKFSEGKNNRLTTAAGFYVGYGFKGKELYYKDPDRTVRNLHRKDNIFKRIDAGFSISAAYEIKERVGVRLDFSRSLFDISRYQWKYSNNVFGFSFFWYLKNKKNIED